MTRITRILKRFAVKSTPHARREFGMIQDKSGLETPPTKEGGTWIYLFL